MYESKYDWAIVGGQKGNATSCAVRLENKSSQFCNNLTQSWQLKLTYYII